MDGLNVWRFIHTTYHPQYVGLTMDGLTLICQHFHEERVLLPAIDDVRGRHPLRQAPRAALHPAWSQRGIDSSACIGTQDGCAGSTGHACMNSRRHNAELRMLLHNTAICKQCVSACSLHSQWLGIRTPCGVCGRASHLGIIPPAMIPSATSSRTCRISRDTNFVATSSLSLSTPGTSVMRMSFSAFNEAAIWMCNYVLLT